MRGTDEGLGISVRGNMTPDSVDDPLTRSEPRFLEAFAGKRNLRDRSVDSTASGNSGKRVTFDSSDEKSATHHATDSVGGLVKSFLPFPRFGGFGRPGGRSASGPVPSTPPLDRSKQLGDVVVKGRPTVDGESHEDVDLNAAESLAQLRKSNPPIRKFMDAKDAKELKIGDVEELLRDYKRLAEILKEAIMT